MPVYSTCFHIDLHRAVVSGEGEPEELLRGARGAQRLRQEAQGLPSHPLGPSGDTLHSTDRLIIYIVWRT